MLKRRLKPGRTRARGSPSRRSSRTQNEWKVETLGAASNWTSCNSVVTRSRISREALFVKVTARTAHGGTLREVMMWAMRCVMTRVLPLPAPARIRSGPSVWLTASRCCALRPLRKSMKGNNLVYHALWHRKCVRAVFRVPGGGLRRRHLASVTWPQSLGEPVVLLEHLLEA